MYVTLLFRLKSLLQMKFYDHHIPVTVFISLRNFISNNFFDIIFNNFKSLYMKKALIQYRFGTYLKQHNFNPLSPHPPSSIFMNIILAKHLKLIQPTNLLKEH